MEYNIFYDNNGKITWATLAECDQATIDAQAENGYSYLQVTVSTLPSIDDYYIADGALVQYGNFNPDLSTTTITLDGTLSLTGIPEGTTVTVDNVNKGTVPADGTITFTGTQVSTRYTVILSKDNYKSKTFTLEVTK